MADQNYSLKEIFGGKDSEDYKNYKEGQKSGKWSDYNDYVSKGGSSSSGPSSNIQRLVEANRNAIRPAVESYQASLPETRATFENQRGNLNEQRSSLTDRFDNLINEIKGGFTRNREDAVRTTSNELGRRGILSSSGLADREIQNAVSPINTAESNAIRDVGYEREDQIRAINNAIESSYLNETNAVRAILNQLAGLESTAGLSGVSMGNTANQFDQTMRFNREQYANSLDQFNKNYALNKAQTDYMINKPYYAPDTSANMLETLSALGLLPSINAGASTSNTPQYTPAYDGVVEGNFISENGRWVPRYEIVQ